MQRHWGNGGRSAGMVGEECLDSWKIAKPRRQGLHTHSGEFRARDSLSAGRVKFLLGLQQPFSGDAGDGVDGEFFHELDFGLF